ncbi:hypothetical protein FDF08_09725 [Micrococcus luteus]|nr:hypothetical protein FDF08_09725 [Micrococcus luteus]
MSVNPRYLLTPPADDVDETHADGAIALAAGYGLVLDDWQQQAVRAWLRCGPDGRFLASTWGLSAARQNGKNAALEAVELYLMTVLGWKIIHTSHKLGSARKAFKRLTKFFGRFKGDPSAPYPELSALIQEFRRTNSQEAIELTNGGLIELSARTSGGARGTSYDLLVVDEAQEYEELEQEALEPTISASAHGQPIVIYLGTPPKTIGERGEPFIRVRSKAVSGQMERTAWVEYGASLEIDRMTDVELQAAVRDDHHVRDANPAVGARVTWETVNGERGRWSARTFARERLNCFPLPRTSSEKAIEEDVWAARHDPDPDPHARLAAVGLDMDPARTKVTITMAYWAEAGVHVEVAAAAPYADAGVASLVAWLWERCKARVPVVIDSFSPARAIEVHLLQKRMKVRVLSAREWADACMGLYDAVSAGAVTHFDQTQLSLAVLAATKAPVGTQGAWRMQWPKDDVDRAPAVAGVCAHFGAMKFGRRPREGAASQKQTGHSFV